MTKELQAQLDHHRRKVDTDRFDLTVRELVRMATDGELHLAPEYQRKFRWDEVRESQLVESLFLGLPIPNVFVATNKDGTWELVDGLQRVTTIMHYSGEPETLEVVEMDEPLRLTGLEKLSEFNGKFLVDLPTAMQLHFHKRAMPLVALSDKSDRVVRFDLFERLNRGGVALAPQEVRACIYRGEFNEFLREMADGSDFKKLLKLQKQKQEDGTAEEFVLKFFAYLDHRAEFKGAVMTFLNDVMAAASEDFDFENGRYLFQTVMQKLAKALNGPLLRTGTAVTPLNQFEGIAVGAAEALRAGRTVQVPKGKAWLDDEELVRHSTKGTNTVVALNGRIDRARELLSGTIKNGGTRMGSPGRGRSSGRASVKKTGRKRQKKAK